MRVDTIVGPITGWGPAAVAWLRLTGPDAYAVASRVFEGWPSEVMPRQAIYGRFVHGDDGLALPFPEGHSYTGEETVELSIHGSPASIRGLLEACQRAGARPAGPGEFTMRAFMNGRLDLAQAEAVAETVEAETERQLREASRNREGALSQRARGIRERALDLLARIEARIDFPEEVGEVDHVEVAATASGLVGDLKKLLKEGRNCHLARQGIRVAILGLPNAGKSSLLNALVGRDRAIVSEIPGTTRDTVEETVEIEGIRFVLIDTAGLREAQDRVEQLGVERSRRAAEEADLVVYVLDSSAKTAEEPPPLLDPRCSLLDSRSSIVVANKCDLAASDYGVAVSCLTGEGLDSLRAALAAHFATETGVPAVNDRQAVAMEDAVQAMAECAEAASRLDPPDLLTVLLTDAISALGRITGETASPDMLDEIFSRFCIGK